MSNKLTTTALEILSIEADLPYRLNYDVSAEIARPSIDDFDLYTFTQVWGSTSLGFGGVGGQAMTEARTYVFVPQVEDQKCFVYFAGKFAYAADYNEAFKEDVRRGAMAPVYKSSKYRRKEAIK